MSSSELESESVILPKRSSIPENQKLLRSLIISGRMSFEPSSNDSSFSRFPSLRALLLVDHAESDRFLESLGKLKHLRFLFLSCTDNPLQCRFWASKSENDWGGQEPAVKVHITTGLWLEPAVSGR